MGSDEFPLLSRTVLQRLREYKDLERPADSDLI